MHERIKHMREILMEAVEEQLCHLECVDAKELGEVVDMIKDLEEAEYYHSVVKAMKESEEQNHGEMMYYTPMYGDKNWKHRETMDWKEEHHPMKHMDDYMDEHKNGKSHKARRMYMEAKEMHSDKTQQMKELEKYAQELTSDIVEMIDDATPEEKQYLSKKITALAAKITQLNTNA